LGNLETKNIVAEALLDYMEKDIELTGYFEGTKICTDGCKDSLAIHQ